MSARTVAELRRQRLLAQRAAEMRARPTRSEAALWEVLRSGKAGFVVRRQVALGTPELAVAKVREALAE